MIVGVTVQDADDGDTTTMVDTVITAVEQVEAVPLAGAGLAELVGDNGHHSNQTLLGARPWRAHVHLGVRSRPAEMERRGCGPLCSVSGPSADSGDERGNACCGSEANGSNARLRISSKPGGSGARPYLRGHPTS